MKKITLLFCLLPMLSFGQIVLKGSLSSGNYGTDVWEYIDSSTGNVYAILGGNGLFVVDVTDPTNPVEVGSNTSVPGFDIKIWENYAYCVTGGGGTNEGAIVDLTNPSNPTTVSNFDSSHNLYIDERGYMFASFPNVVIYDLNPDPTNPLYLTDIGTEGHDVTVRGNRMIDTHGYAGTFIYDVTDPANPTELVHITDPTITYHHQGDFSTDGNYAYICDELGNHPQADISVWDISDIANPQRVSEVADPTATPHNMYVIDDYAYASYYTAGLKIFDISDPSQLVLADSYDTNSSTGEGFSGAFGVYPSEATGNIYINDGNGLYVFGFDALGVNDVTTDTMALSPNPASGNVSLRTNQTSIEIIQVFSILGKKVLEIENTTAVNQYNLDISSLSAGAYFVKVNNLKAEKLLVE